MKYKMIISDFDGTIFSHNSMSIPSNVIASIDKYTRLGGRFALCTGRMFLSIRDHALTLPGISDEILCLQGSACYSLSTGKELFATDISADESYRIACFLEKQGWVFQIYKDVRMFTKEPNKYTDIYEALTGIRATYTCERLSELLSREMFSTHKIVVMTEPDADQEKMELIRAEFPDLDVSKSNPYFIELVDRAGGKGNGVKKLAEHLGVSLDEIAIFGDETNDLTMLQIAGLSCVPINGAEKAKEIADIVYKSVDIGGASEIIENIISDEV